MKKKILTVVFLLLLVVNIFIGAIQIYLKYNENIAKPDNYAESAKDQYDGLEDGSISANKTTFATTGKNLFDKSKVVIGYVVNELTGEVYANESYVTSDFITVEPSKDYVSSFSRATAYYDINKNYISGAEYTTAITTPIECYYVRVSSSGTN